jgi:hypothetical protein
MGQPKTKSGSADRSPQRPDQADVPLIEIEGKHSAEGRGGPGISPAASRETPDASESKGKSSNRGSSKGSPGQSKTSPVQSPQGSKLNLILYKS